MALVQVSQLGDWLGWDNARVTNERDRLTRLTETASSSIERKCGRSFGQVTERREFDVRRLTNEIPIGDITAATLVEHRYYINADYAPLAASDYELVGVTGRPARWLRRTDRYYFQAGGDAAVRVTGTWGWPQVPADIQQAVIMEASRLMMRQQSPQGNLTTAGGMDYDMRNTYDPDILDIIDNYKIAVIE